MYLSFKNTIKHILLDPLLTQLIYLSMLILKGSEDCRSVMNPLG
jgi:hypothetical protein